MIMLDEWKKDLENILTKICASQCTCKNLCDKTIDANYPWELLDSFLKKKFHLRYHYDVKGQHIGTDVGKEISAKLYLGKGSKIKSPGGRIEGDVYIGENTIINPNTYLRGPLIIGDNCVVGGVIKNSIILHDSKLAHQVYVGDSVIGRNCLLGAGVKLSNLRLDNWNVKIMYKGVCHDSKRRKLGAILEDDVSLGCNLVLNPGEYITSGWIITLDPKERISIKK